VAAVAVVVGLIAACDGGGDEPAETPTFAEVQTRVFAASCAFATCHIGASPAGGLSLDGDPYDDLVDAPAMENDAFVRVEPGNPDASYMLMKLEGMAGSVMPPTEPLSDERLSLVRDWIAGGAPR
jgi:hypothetical protein